MREATSIVYGLKYIVILLGAFVAACASAQAPAGAVVNASTPSAQVLPGIEVLLAGDMAGLRGLRVGLITNHTGKLRDGSTTIDALHNDSRLELVCLFAPEHGYYQRLLAREESELGLSLIVGRWHCAYIVKRLVCQGQDEHGLRSDAEVL